MRATYIKTLALALMSLSAKELIAAPAPLIPLKEFFRNPSEAGHDLSPDGENILLLKPWENRMNVWVQPTQGGEARRITAVTERDIPGAFWINNRAIAYPMDDGGDENFHIFLVGLDGADPKDITPYEETRAEVIDVLKRDPERMLISHNQRDKRVFDLYRYNLTTGESKLVVENPGNITSYIADHEGQVRVATSNDGVNTSLLYRETEDEEFQNVLTTNFRETLTPYFFTYDNKRLYAASNLGRDTEAAVIFDPVTAEESEVLYVHPQVDIGGILASDEREKVTGVTFIAAKRGYAFFDDTRAEIQRFLENQLPGYEVSVVSSSLDESRFLVRGSSSRTRGAYYFYDHNTKEFRKLADISPWLEESQMAKMEPITYQSRDGLFIHGYLTLPVGVEASNLPTVILPHGGPWARDTWGFRPDVQFLANRGYAVLQMNFRGSTGFGRKFWEMSFKEWGKTMQDDITDGVQWLIDRGVADPKRVGIYGGSYGGYAVLAGLTFTPDLYACGVDYVGVSNLFTILETIPPYWEPMRDMMYEMMGDPEADKTLMRAASPVFHADKITAPLLIVQGANDPRVKKAESDQMVEALRAREVDVPYMVKDNEGHGFRNEENKFEMYRAAEQFFAKHLGGRLGKGDDVLKTLYDE